MLPLFSVLLSLPILRILLSRHANFWVFSSVQFSSVTPSYPTLWDPMDCSTPGFPVPHQLPEFPQTYVHWVGDAIQLSHPLLFPSPPAFNLPSIRSFPVSQFFTSGGQRIGVSALASVLPMNIQHWFPLGWTGWISMQSKGLSRIFSNTTVHNHQFFGTHPYMTTGNTIALSRWTLFAKWCLCFLTCCLGP